MKKLLLLIAILTAPLAAALPASASDVFDPLGNVCDDANQSPVCVENREGQLGEDPISGESSIVTTIANILTIVTAVIGIIVILVAGITMTLSGGDSTKVQNSRNAIIYAAVGIIVVALARTIVLFVANRI